MRRGKLVIIFIISLLMSFSLGAAGPVPPPVAEMEFNFAGLDAGTLKALVSQGSLTIVRQNPDLSLINVTVGRLVEAPLDTVWETITDFEQYPEFMAQTASQKILERESDNRLVVEQTIALKIWRIPAIDITYQLAYELTPKSRLRFWHVKGHLEGTYGGWDLVPLGDETMIFYTLHSNLTALGLGLGALFRSEPDFMAGINVTTAMVATRCIKQECERRAKR